MLTLEIQADLWSQIQALAKQMQDSPESVVLTILKERLEEESKGITYPESEGAKVDRVLREAGMLSYPGPALISLAEELETSLGSAKEKAKRRRELEALELQPPMSQDILEMRGPKA